MIRLINTGTIDCPKNGTVLCMCDLYIIEVEYCLHPGNIRPHWGEFDKIISRINAEN